MKYTVSSTRQSIIGVMNVTKSGNCNFQLKVTI